MHQLLVVLTITLISVTPLIAQEDSTVARTAGSTSGPLIGLRIDHTFSTTSTTVGDFSVFDSPACGIYENGSIDDWKLGITAELPRLVGDFAGVALSISAVPTSVVYAANPVGPQFLYNEVTRRRDTIDRHFELDERGLAARFALAFPLAVTSRLSIIPGIALGVPIGLTTSAVDHIELPGASDSRPLEYARHYQPATHLAATLSLGYALEAGDRFRLRPEITGSLRSHVETRNDQRARRIGVSRNRRPVGSGTARDADPAPAATAATARALHRRSGR